MRIALYNENTDERKELERQLRVCGKEALRKVEVIAYGNHVDFCRAIQDTPGEFDLLMVAQDGTFSLEIMDYLQAHRMADRVLWFSDLDFGVRSYAYRALWFGRKPIAMPILRKAFARAMEYVVHPAQPGETITESKYDGERIVRTERAPLGLS